MDPEMAARSLATHGYCQVSRSYRIVARVDIPGWKMVRKFIRENFGDSSSGIPSLSLEEQEDYYRRCESKDVIIEVPEDVFCMLISLGDYRRVTRTDYEREIEKGGVPGIN